MPRRCGICGQEGHDRRRCPQRHDGADDAITTSLNTHMDWNKQHQFWLAQNIGLIHPDHTFAMYLHSQTLLQSMEMVKTGWEMAEVVHLMNIPNVSPGKWLGIIYNLNPVGQTHTTPHGNTIQITYQSFCGVADTIYAGARAHAGGWDATMTCCQLYQRVVVRCVADNHLHTPVPIIHRVVERPNRPPQSQPRQVVKEVIPDHIKKIYIEAMVAKKECCPICMDEVKVDTAELSGCGHLYCKDCYTRGVLAPKKCAVCRTPC